MKEGMRMKRYSLQNNKAAARGSNHSAFIKMTNNYLSGTNKYRIPKFCLNDCLSPQLLPSIVFSTEESKSMKAVPLAHLICYETTC